MLLASSSMDALIVESESKNFASSRCLFFSTQSQLAFDMYGLINVSPINVVKFLFLSNYASDFE